MTAAALSCWLLGPPGLLGGVCRGSACAGREATRGAVKEPRAQKFCVRHEPE